MGHSKMNIVCYTGGTCGDMISAILDPIGTRFRHTAVMIDHADRSRLKKPHLFQSDQEKDQYLIEIEKKYQSIPSHDLDYHVRKKHNFIGITVQDKAVALWAAKRFKQLHRAHVWYQMDNARADQLYHLASASKVPWQACIKSGVISRLFCIIYRVI